MITAAALAFRLGESEVAALGLGAAETLQQDMDMAINPAELDLRNDTIAGLQMDFAPELDRWLDQGRALDPAAAVDRLLAALEGGSKSAERGQSDSSVAGSGGGGGTYGGGYA